MKMETTIQGLGLSGEGLGFRGWGLATGLRFEIRVGSSGIGYGVRD